MIRLLILFGLLLLFLLILDGLWLGLIAKNFMREKIGYLFADKPNWVAAAVFYLMYTFGILYFALQPALLAGQWQEALLKGALFGLIAYGTYDLTNLAVVKNWPVVVTVVDMCWGMVMTAIVTVIVFAISGKIYS
ncbi:MAG: DUF2177 family protein [Chitinophagales bacterium]